MAGDRALRVARELERDDERLAHGLGEVVGLAAAVEEVRARAAAVVSFRERLPGEREAAATAAAAAEADVGRRREVVAAARSELERAESRRRRRDDVEAARRALERARDALGLAERRLAGAVERAAALERDGAAAEREEAELADRARLLAAGLAQVPRISRAGALAPPGAGIAGTLEWASRARAALFVVRSGLETERERVVREANELLASATGEPGAGTSVALVRRRLEARAAGH